MSLNWELKKIANWRELTTHADDRHLLVDPDAEEKHEIRWNPVSKALIFGTMTIDMGEITEKNWREVYRRVHLYEKLCGCFLQFHRNGEIVDQPITPQDIRDHIGLSTNVCTEKPATWNARLMKMAQRDIDASLRDFK